MAIVTFLSDFGHTDHYVAAVKASIWKENPSINIVDISHAVDLGDIGHAAFVLTEVFRDFPKGTVHLVCVTNSARNATKKVVVKLEDHLFIGDDTGLFSLLSEQPPSVIVELNGFDASQSTFHARDFLGPLAAKVASGKDIQDFGKRLEELERLMPSRAKATKAQIAGNIMRVDHYGNLITNILKEDFENILKLNNDCPFEVNFRREKINKIHQGYREVGSGECFVIFNSNGRLQIGINQGNGSELLGLTVNDQVFLDFKREV